MGKRVQGRAGHALRQSATHQHGAVRLLPATGKRSATMRDAPRDPVHSNAPLVSGALALLEAPAAPDALVRPAPARRHILIVEDDARTVDVLRNALELDGEPGWSVASAGDGPRALALAARVPPDVVLLDVRLPGLDGGEVYRRLRAIHANARTRVLILSAGTALDLAQRGIHDGVLLRKPFALPELVALVRSLLAG
ncbi:MAG TPA: response regulator [Ktedonobacterales bacterium]